MLLLLWGLHTHLTRGMDFSLAPCIAPALLTLSRVGLGSWYWHCSLTAPGWDVTEQLLQHAWPSRRPWCLQGQQVPKGAARRV